MAILIVDYLKAVIHYWWVLSLGSVLPVLNLIKWGHQERKELHVPYWLRLTVIIVAFIVAQFFAYRDSIKNLSQVIQEKQVLSSANGQLVSERSNLRLEVKDLEAKLKQNPRTTKEQVPKQCWMANHFESPNPNIPEAHSATSVIIHCNYKLEVPYMVAVKFDTDFIQGSLILPESGISNHGEEKQGTVLLGQVTSPPLPSQGVIIAHVMGTTGRYPRGLGVSIKELK